MKASEALEISKSGQYSGIIDLIKLASKDGDKSIRIGYNLNNDTLEALKINGYSVITEPVLPNHGQCYSGAVLITIDWSNPTA
jgi:hypothetical protein